jgi:dTMP kinase
MEKGLFITIYGINNIGKSTNAKLLVEKLKNAGHKAVYLKYPVYDLEPSGPFLNKILRNGGVQKISEDELQLWFILNRYQFESSLKKLLNDGNIVIAEDYIGTGIAWGVAKGLDQKWLEDGNKYLLKEDLAILLVGERHTRSKEKVHVHEQNDELAKKCANIFDMLADKFGWEKVVVQKKAEDTSNLLFDLCKRKIE